jgi:hypothetical protein
LGEHLAFFRDAGGEDVIECGDPVSSDEEQALGIKIVDVPDLAARVKREAFNISLQDDSLGDQVSSPLKFLRRERKF